MPEFVADFHLHSRYRRATSSQLTVPELAKWAALKGIGLLGTGDFTHPLWLQELQQVLQPAGPGLYALGQTRFVLTAEINTLFYKHGKAHSIHQLLMAPSFETVERINRELAPFGSLTTDGRPLLQMEAWRLVEIALGVDPRCLVVPAHAWIWNNGWSEHPGYHCRDHKDCEGKTKRACDSKAFS